MSASLASSLPRNKQTAVANERIGGLRSGEHSSVRTLISVETDDFDEFREHAKGWSIDHQLHGTLKPQSALSGLVTQTLQIAVLRHSMGYCSQGQNPQGALSICFPLDDRPVRYRGQNIENMQAPLIRGSEGFELICPSGAHFLILSVPEEKAERYANEVTLKALWPQPADRLRFADAPRKLRHVQVLKDLLKTLEADPSLLKDEKAVTLVEQKALECLPVATGEDSGASEDRNRYRVARQAYRFLHEREDVPSIRELCVATRASYATLERGFQEMYGMAPKVLIQDLKLSRARTALLHPESSTTVTSVALSVGFLEFGRFSLLYKQRFGESPSATLGRSRGTLTDS